jgi:hypothetical protein
MNKVVGPCPTCDHQVGREWDEERQEINYIVQRPHPGVGGGLEGREKCLEAPEQAKAKSCCYCDARAEQSNAPPLRFIGIPCLELFWLVRGCAGVGQSCIDNGCWQGLRCGDGSFGSLRWSVSSVEGRIRKLFLGMTNLSRTH